MFLRRGTHDSVKKQNENFKVQGSSHSYSDSSVQNTNFSSFINKKEKKLHYLYFVEKAVVPIKRRCKKRKFVNRFSRWRLLWFRSSANSYKRLTLPYLEKEIGGKSKAWVTTPANCSICFRFSTKLTKNMSSAKAKPGKRKPAATKAPAATKKPRKPRGMIELPVGIILTDLTKKTWRIGRLIGWGGFGALYLGIEISFYRYNKAIITLRFT